MGRFGRESSLSLWYIKATVEKRGASFERKRVLLGGIRGGVEKQLDGLGGGAYAENSRRLNPFRG